MLAKLKSLIKYLALSLILILLLLATLFMVMDREDKALNTDTRKQLGGRYVALSKGYTHYQLEESKNAPLVVLIHGFSVPSYLWQPTYEHLLAQGFSVLRYDIYGRGFSDRPDQAYTMDLYVEQLSELLAALNIVKPVSIVGLSMGGAVAAHFAAAFPDQTQSVSLFAPLIQTPVKEEMRPLLQNGVGEYLSAVVLVPKITSDSSKAVFDQSSFPDWEQRFTPQTHYKGFRRAILSSIRNLAGKDFSPAYQALAKHNIPVQLIWGTEDQTLPFKDSELVRQAIPSLEFTSLNQTGHLPHYEQPDKVNAVLTQFLNRNSNK